MIKAENWQNEAYVNFDGQKAIKLIDEIFVRVKKQKNMLISYCLMIMIILKS